MVGRSWCDGDDGRHLEVADRDPEPLEAAEDAGRLPRPGRGRSPRPPRAGPSRRGPASSGSALPPGKLTSPLWWPSRLARSVRTTRARPDVVRVERGRGRPPGRPGRPAGGVRGRRRSPPPMRTGMRISAGAGSGSGRASRRATASVEAHRRRRIRAGHVPPRRGGAAPGRAAPAPGPSASSSRSPPGTGDARLDPSRPRVALRRRPRSRPSSSRSRTRACR